MKRNAITGIAMLVLAIMAALGCTPTAQETELLPPSRDGMFYLNFAEAKSVALADNKMILLELWRPG